MEQKLELSPTERHIALYAKRHYRHGQDAVEDLRTIICHLAGLDREQLGLFGLYKTVAEVFAVFASRESEHRLSEFMNNLAFDYWFITHKQEVPITWIIEKMLAFIALVHLSERPDGLIIDLGEPDYSILSAPE